MTETAAWDTVVTRGRMSLAARAGRLRLKAWQVGQCAVAAGVAWWLAKDVLDHPTPFFAPIAAVVSLGTSYGQRLRRVAEVTLGVAIGVLVADLLVLWLGAGAWQLTLIVALSMSTALLLDAGALFVTQAAVQAIVITALAADPDQALLRWTDALIGGAVALVAATLVPGAPLRRPGQQAAKVVRKITALLRGAAAGMTEADVTETLALLADARSTDTLIRELSDAADEGLSVLASSPFWIRRKPVVRQIAELVEPLDLAIRNTRVLVRRVAVAAYQGQPMPASYARLCLDLAAAADLVADELDDAAADHPAGLARPLLLELAAETSRVEHSDVLSAQAALAQLRSLIADLLRITGLGVLESTDAIPPRAG